MIKSKKGITLVVLTITIVVMLIIAGVTVTAGTGVIKNAQKNRLKTNLYLVKIRAEALLEDYLFDGSGDLGTAENDPQTVLDVGFNNWGNDDYIYYIWNIEKLEEEGIDTSNVSDNEKFIIEYNLVESSVDVASTKGFTDSDGTTIYKLSDF